jgi:hypothetical protein
MIPLPLAHLFFFFSCTKCFYSYMYLVVFFIILLLGIPEAKDSQKGDKGALALAPPLLPKAP